MSETLYRKYRPQTFSEIIGQAHIVRTLSNAVKHDRVGQAYLFTGPRGTGKTSVARILAKTVNCANLASEGRANTKLNIRRSDAKADTFLDSCGKCQNCKLIEDDRSLDIIEIDAASNTGVDNIRELRETVNLPPTSLRYKVYIIDEVHMLSTGAFNALLKTLEEPPSHVIFILATTEIHKIPETILSRCQRFDFTRLPFQSIVEKLSFIAKSEKVKIDQEALEMIAISSEGGMRDAESLLGQIISLEDKKITAKEVEEILGTTDRKFAYKFADSIISNETDSAISKINTLLEDGYDLEIFTKTFINYLRQLMLISVDEKLKEYFTYELPKEQLEKMVAQVSRTSLPKIISMINIFLEAQEKISRSAIPQLPLEIAIIKATRNFPENQGSSSEEGTAMVKGSVAASPGTASPPVKAIVLEKKPPLKVEIETKIKTEKTDEKKSETLEASDLDIATVKENWGKLLLDIRPYNHSLNALLYNCQVIKIEGAKITIATPYDFYREKLSDPNNKLTIEEVFSSILGLKISITTVVDRSLVPQKALEEIVLAEEKKSQPAGNASRSDAGRQDTLLTSALEIMGGKLVEE